MGKRFVVDADGQKRTVGKKPNMQPCPFCKRVVHVAGRLVSYHPPCRAETLDDRRKYKLKRR
jgi:hypothetical protein